MRIGACLSLTGRFERFGVQVARGLEVWSRLSGVELVIEDDASDPHGFAARLRRVAGRCDLLLGPYSTQLMRAAGAALLELDALLWNHGGAGDDVQALGPGRIVSVLAPTSLYALPFVPVAAAPLWVATGPGLFGRQIAEGAVRAGGELVTAEDFQHAPAAWDLLTAGRFEDDVALVDAARTARNPPRAICSIAAGVQDFAAYDPDGIYGIAQWMPGNAARPDLGPSEREFIAAYGSVPDYPAVQAVAAAVIAFHCAELAGSTEPDALFAAAVALETTTLFGAFKVDPVTGAQTGHTPVLVRWRDGVRTFTRA
jgi:ABC-type branched-subunit amino acid transport system substrate-binding protein